MGKVTKKGRLKATAGLGEFINSEKMRLFDGATPERQAQFRRAERRHVIFQAWYPLLLLDDVMSELDAARRDAIVGFIADEIQTVITTTNLGYFADDMLARARVIRIGDV